MQLPFVTKQTGYAVSREVAREEGNQYVAKMLRRLQGENPCVAEFVSRLSMVHEDPIALTTAALIVYRLLESQAEADSLRREIEHE